MSGLLLMMLVSAGTTAPGQPGVDVRLYPPAPDVVEQRTGRPDVVIKWNREALEAVRTDRSPPPLAARNLAMLHVAIFDAVNAVHGKYLPYKVTATAPPGTSAEAAAAAAAHQTLSILYPRQREAFDVLLRACLAEVADGPGRDAGVDLGRSVADRILAWRADDGAANPGTHAPRGGPGLWQPTPPAFRAALLPDWGHVAPFAIRKGTQYRPPAPHPVGSPAYLTAYRDVKLLGGKHSTARTADQTEIARFWADDAGTSTPPGHWNRIAQTVALKRGHGMLENARLFALLNVSLADAGVLCWVLKFTYDFWRPVTAIRSTEEDGNPDPDPGWEPLLTTPPFPSYTSGHSTFSGAASAVLERFCGTDRFAFTDTSEGLAGVTRSFPGFSAAAAEAGRSRIYGGIHWEFDNAEGLAVGRHLGQYVHRHFFLPRPPVVTERRSAEPAPGPGSP